MAQRSRQGWHVGLAGIAIVGMAGLAGCSSSSTPPASNAASGGGGAGSGNGADCPATGFKDPSDGYKVRTDPVLTKVPEPCITIGTGQILNFTYNGPEKENSGTLSYQAYYVNTDGGVINITGGSMKGDGAGNYTMEATFSTSGAKGRPGFLEITATTGAKVGANGIEGKNTSLAMLPVKFDIAS